MRTGRSDLVITAYFVFGILCSNAFAEDYSYVGLRGSYVSAGTTDTQFDATSPRFNLDYGSGFGVGVDVGRTFGSFRTEVELAHIRVGPNAAFPATGVEFQLSDRYWMGLVGVYYDFEISSALIAYVGGGGGVVVRNAEVIQLTPLPPRIGAIDKTSFGVFGEAGVDIAISSSVSLFSAFRYLEHNDGLSTSSSNVWVGFRKKF